MVEQPLLYYAHYTQAMQDKKDRTRHKLEVEDLLKMKRFERPDAQFWERFDRELHQRQLQALVHRESAFGRAWRQIVASLNPALGVSMAGVLVAAFVALTSFQPAVEQPQEDGMIGFSLEAPAQTIDVAAVQAADGRPVKAHSFFAVETIPATPARAQPYISVAANREMETGAGAGVYYVSGDLSSRGRADAAPTVY